VSPAVGLEPAVGVVAGGIAGPAVGLLVPRQFAREQAPLGSPASAERFAMPGAHFDDPREEEVGR
jgi:hypothetical protein